MNYSAKEGSPYKGTLTREQFCFHEMRTTAKLMNEGLSDEEIEKKISEENLYQYPTERSVHRLIKMCIKRLNAMNDKDLISAIAVQPSDISKQICLYAMMKDSRIVWDFMLTVIAEKYRELDFSFGKKDLNAFILRLQEQNETVASWSDSTITKVKQVLVKTLVENEYLDNVRSDKLNPVLISSVLLNAIKTNGDNAALPAFNYFE